MPPSPSPDLIVGEDRLARPRWASADALLRDYYDTEWGNPVRTEQGVFERLSLEAFQSGLSWATILRKRPAFREAFVDFAPERVATFGETEVESLLHNAGIVRNRAKILATINNAQATIAMRDHPRGGLERLVWDYVPEQQLAPQTMAEVPTSTPGSTALAKELRSLGFRFVGPTTMFALMEAIGIVNTHLVGSHRRSVSPTQ